MRPCRECGKPISTEAKACPNCGANRPTKQPTPGWLKVLLGFGVLFIVIQFSRMPKTVTEAELEAPYRDSLVAEVQWKLGGFDNVMLAEITVANLGSRVVRDVGIACDLFAPSGTRVGGATHDILDIVPAHDTLRTGEVNMGIVSNQASRAGCSIYDFDF
jgi:hypothetical protein